MKKNGFAPVIVILVIAILGVVGYLGYKNLPKSISSKLTPSPISTISSDISTWETYTDKTYSYFIRYPKGWFINSLTKNEVHIANFTNEQLTDQEKKDILGGLKKDVASIVIGVYEETITNETPLLDWMKANDHYISGMSGEPTSVKQTTIAGYPGLILNYEGTGLFYVFSAKSHVYYAFLDSNDSRFDRVIDQILSTFKLTK